jgi:hypothetical protein
MFYIGDIFVTFMKSQAFAVIAQAIVIQINIPIALPGVTAMMVAAYNAVDGRRCRCCWNRCGGCISRW